jgi:hypothetical protein
MRRGPDVLRDSVRRLRAVKFAHRPGVRDFSVRYRLFRRVYELLHQPILSIRRCKFACARFRRCWRNSFSS